MAFQGAGVTTNRLILSYLQPPKTSLIYPEITGKFIEIRDGSSNSCQKTTFISGA